MEMLIEGKYEIEEKNHEGRVLMEYLGNETCITIPEGIEVISSDAFNKDKNIKEIIFPKSLKRIKDAAFYESPCLESITIRSDHCAHIQSGAFRGCKALKQVYFLGKVSFNTGIYGNDFYGGPFMHCISLEKVEIDSGYIMKNCFYGCSNLKEVIFKSPPSFVGKDAFSSCHKDLIVKFDFEDLRSETIPFIENVKFDLIDDRIAELWLFQNGKPWRAWLYKEPRFQQAEQVFNAMLRILAQEKKINKAQGLNFADFYLKYKKDICTEQIQKAIEILENKKCPVVTQFKRLPGIQKISNKIEDQVNPIESRVEEYLNRMKVNPKVEYAVKTGVRFLDSDNYCSKNVIIYLISAYPFNQGKAFYNNKLRIKKEADQIASILDKRELSKLLTKLVNGSNYDLFLFSWARYAIDEDIENTFNKYLTFSRGKPRFDNKGKIFFNALIYSDTIAAMKFYDRCGELELYANQRNMNAMEMRDTTMLPDFSFDNDGIKRYDIGGNTIEVRISQELEIQLFDVNKQKVIRSFPKTSNEPDKVEKCAADFAEFKKLMLAFSKERSALIHKMHMSGEYVKREYWEKIYIQHPVVKRLAALVVWQDNKGNTFIVDEEKGIIDSAGFSYEPEEMVRVAHVTDLLPEDIISWQQWFIKVGKKQLFEQIWEPVISWTKDDIVNRYYGIVIGKNERNTIKNALKRRFINAFSEDIDKEFNTRTGKYEFSNEGILDYGNCLKLEYTVDPDSNETTFGRAKSLVKPGDREMNAVLLELDRAIISFQISKDNDSALLSNNLTVFSVAQIQSLLSLAIEKSATKCTAIILDYKNKHFPGFAKVDEYSLDW